MPNEREKGSKVIIFKRRDINTQKLEEEIAEEGKGFVEIPVGSDSGLPLIAISSDGIFSISTLENLSNRNHQQEKKRKKKKERQNP